MPRFTAGEKRVCARCGGEYAASAYNQRYCTACRAEAVRERMRAYYRANSEKCLAYQRRRYREHGRRYEPRPEHGYIACRRCGAPFEPYTLTTSYYCSKACRDAAWREAKRARKEAGDGDLR